MNHIEADWIKSNNYKCLCSKQLMDWFKKAAPGNAFGNILQISLREFR